MPQRNTQKVEDQGKPTFDTKEAAVYCMEQFELVKPLLGNIPWDDLESMRESEEILVARAAVNYVLRDDETTGSFPEGGAQTK
ncbi:MAG: hypothetical protein U5K79_02225 [Cyclobacteriaceae bacterium]|nr:hypothetical protein [Cyclobacteriaceae bacterium]